jgi:DNA-binding transcriptional ArsR family regulator
MKPSNAALAEIFTALGDPTRIALVARLCDGDATVGELAEPHNMSVQAISKHLKVLEDAGLVTKTKDAQRRNVHFEAEVFDLMTKWIERYRRQAERRFQRLDAVLAEMNTTDTRSRTPGSRTTASRPSVKRKTS